MSYWQTWYFISHFWDRPVPIFSMHV
jgi:hypothetical protein